MDSDRPSVSPWRRKGKQGQRRGTGGVWKRLPSPDGGLPERERQAEEGSSHLAVWVRGWKARRRGRAAVGMETALAAQW